MKKRIQQRKTLLVVGEGDTEVAFLTYLKRIYCQGENTVKVTVKNAYGKGPEHVLDHAQRCCRTVAYDKVAVFMDTDIPWTKELLAQAKKSGIALIGNTPCIEGLFLLLLNKPVPRLSADCKTKIKQALKKKNLLMPDDYEGWCTAELLGNPKFNEQALGNLIFGTGTFTWRAMSSMAPTRASSSRLFPA